MYKIDKYENIGILGEGTYGTVYKATHLITKEIVAIKQIELDDEQGLLLPTIREIKNLTRLKSEHTVCIKEVILEKNKVFLIMEYLPFDLTGLIRMNYHFDNDAFLSLTHDILSAVSYLHGRGLIHRDIKSSNILLTRKGRVKLVDFGLTRNKCTYMTNRVCTLWYRAPELLLGCQNYDEKVDSWSIGCVLLELRLKTIPFKGNDEASQIRNIFTQLGAPNETYIWSEMTEQSKYIKNESFFDTLKKNFGQYFNVNMLYLLSKLLNPTVRDRYTASEALSLNLFDKFIPKFNEISLEEANEYKTNKSIL